MLAHPCVCFSHTAFMGEHITGTAHRVAMMYRRFFGHPGVGALGILLHLSMCGILFLLVHGLQSDNRPAGGAFDQIMPRLEKAYI